MSTQTSQSLAIDGGPPARTSPWPSRNLFTHEEKTAANRLLDRCIETGAAYGYGGEEELGYCKEFVEWIDASADGYADMVNSGSTAVYVALRSLDLPPFSEIIVPPLTDSGGIMPIALLGCIPVVADTAPDSYNVGPEQIATCITPRTRAIIVTHIGGKPCDMEPILDLAHQHQLYIVEDCAQSHGATYKGQTVGTFGDVAAFSTMSGKHHATGGQGGVVYTRDKDRYLLARRAADRGKPIGDDPADGGSVLASLNFNQDEMGAAIGRVQLRKLPSFVERRRAFANAVSAGCESLKAFTVDGDEPECENSFWFLLLRMDETQLRVGRDAVIKALNAEGIPASTYWFSPSDHTWFKNRRAFGSSTYPWNSPQYTGNSSRPVILDNLIDAASRRILITMHENCGSQEAEDVISALEKIEATYLKQQA